MLDQWVKKATWMILLAVVGVVLLPVPAWAALYDASGRWAVTYTPTSPAVAGCLLSHAEPFVATIAQNGDAFTLSKGGEVLDTGSVGFDEYHATLTKTDNSAREILFTLAGETSGSGTLTTTWPNPLGGVACTASGSLSLYRAMDAVFQASGSWQMQISEDEVDTTLSGASCTISPAVTLQADIIQNANTFLISLDSSPLKSGDVDGGYFTYTTLASGAGTKESAYRFLMTNQNSASGTIDWVRSDGATVCVGSNDFSMRRLNTGSLDPTTTLAVAPMNMVVGNTRVVSIEHATGTPDISLSPASGIVTKTTTSGITSLTCDAPGQVIVIVTDASGSASAPVSCVAASGTGAGVVYQLADWLFLNDVILVAQNFWQSSQDGVWDSQGFRWSKATGTSSFLDRGTVSTLVGDETQYFTMDANGLTFHGEQRYDIAKDQQTRMAQYSFVNAPNLDFGSVDIRPEQVASTNLKSPGSMLPASVADGYAATVTRIEYPLNANDQPVAGQWVVSKSEIAVTGRVNLLDTVVPAELQNDVEFMTWRDTVTDLDLLNKLTNVLRIHLIETRYVPGSVTPTIEAGYLYLAQGVGIVYEFWQESDGISKQLLMAKESGSGLVSLTNLPIAAKRFRVDAPAGVVLDKPFVQLRVEHTTGSFALTPHVHEMESSYNQTPGSNSASLTHYAQANSPSWDSTSVARLTYGAQGFERQLVAELAVDTLADPMILTLSAAHQGQVVQFGVKDEAGTPITQAGMRIAPYQNGACNMNLGFYHELSSTGTVTVTLASTPHCLEIWPTNSGDFIGGYYDASVQSGQVNVIAGASATSFTLLSSVTEIALLVARDDIPDYRRVSGVLTDGMNGLANAEVLAFPDGSSTPVVTHTDSNGAFTLDLLMGNYSFVFRYVNGGRIYQAYLSAMGESNTLSVTPSDAQGIYVDTLLGQVNLTASFQVNSVALSGVITNGTTSQLDGFTSVSVMSPTLGGYASTTTTDANGAFSLLVPVNGDYLIQVEAKRTGMVYRGYVDGYKLLSANLADLTTVSVYNVLALNLTLTDAMGLATYPITGQVKDNATSPVALAGVRVRAVDQANSGTVFETITDALGNFSLAVTSGSYKIEVSAHNYVGGLAKGTVSAVTLGGTSAAQVYLLGSGTGAQTSLILNPVLAKVAGTGDPDIAKITVTGLATSTGGALQNILVEFLPDWESNTGFVAPAAVKTDATGHYTASIYPGLYRLFFRAEYWDVTTNQMVKVPGVLGQGGFADGSGQAVGQEKDAMLFDLRATSQVNVAFSSGVQVSGRVTDSAGQPILNVRVEFQPDTDSTTSVATWVETQTDASGNYSAYIQPGATYRVYFNTDYWNWATQTPVKVSGLSGFAYDGANNGVTGDESAAKKYSFTDKTTLNATLATGLTLSGVVTSDGLSGFVPGVLVRLQPEWDPVSGQSGTWGETITDANGKYSFTVQPGQYRVEFLTSYWRWTTNQQVNVPGNLIGGFANGTGGISNDWMAANIFQVTDAVVINAQLPAGMTLSGTVTTTDGTAVVGAEVNVHSKDWTVFFREKTDQQGAFSFSVTPGLDYQVEVWPAYCATGNTNAAVGCGTGYLEFLGGNWITSPDNTTWVKGWEADNPASEPLVTASLVTGPVPGLVMAQSDSHVVTNIRMDQSLALAVQVSVGTLVRGRVVDDENHGVPWAWVSSDFGSGPTDQEGFFTLNIPTGNVVTSVNSSFSIDIFPGGYQDPVSNAWIQGTSFIGGVVTGNSTNGFSVTGDWSQATPFASSLASTAANQVTWPQLDLGNEQWSGLKVRVSRGMAITGSVKSGTQGVANMWVNAWSHDSAVGGGVATQSNGDFSIQVPTPAAGTSVWYELNVWGYNYLAPEPVLVKVTSTGVVGVYAIDKVNSFDQETGLFKPVALTEALVADPNGGVPVYFVLTTGNKISGRVTDASNNGLPWMWVDVHTKDGTKGYGASTDENGYYSVIVEPAANYVGVVWGVNGQYRSQFYKNAINEESATLIDASGSNNPSNINFSMSAGAKITGSILGLSSGQKLWLNVWSDKQRSWGGTEVNGIGNGATAVSFAIKGLAAADDYRLDWNADTDLIPNGFYGGVPGSGTASGPKSWEQSTQLNTLNGNVTGVVISLVVPTKTLTVKVDGLTAGSKVDVDARSEKLNKGRWKQATANGAGEAVIELKGLENSDDYRLFVGGPNATFKVGYLKGSVNTAGYPTAAGILVGRDRATKIDLSLDGYAYVTVSSGRQLTVAVSGLTSGQKAWVDAFSESTWAMSGGEVTATNGTVVIKGLEAADDYRVSIWSPQIMGGSYAGDGKAPGPWETAQLVDVSGGDKTITMAVSSGKSIQGNVSGLSASQSGWVDAWSNSTFSWGGASVQGAGAATPVAYTLAGLASAADFQVNFNAPGFVPQELSNKSTVAGNLTGVDFTASTGGSITGSITGLNAYEWVRVDAWSGVTDKFIMGGVAANSSGAATYTLSGVPAATDYVVAVWRGDRGLFYTTTGVTPVWDNHSKVTVTGSGTTSSIDFNLTAAGNLFYTLSGTISGISTAQASQVVEVHAWSATGGASTTVTGNATFTLEGLPAGNYTVEVFSNGYIPQRTKSVTVANNAVTAVTWTTGWNDMGTVAVAGNMTGLNIALSSGYSIKGTVKNSSNTALSGVWVNAWSASANVGGGVLTNSLGEFTIKGLPGSLTYKVDVWTPDGFNSTDVQVTTENKTGVTLTIGKATGFITGTVSGTGAGGALILAYDSAGVEKKRVLAHATTGAYTLDDLTPEQTYSVIVYSSTKVKAGTWSVKTSGYAEGSAKATASGATLSLTLN